MRGSAVRLWSWVGLRLGGDCFWIECGSSPILWSSVPQPATCLIILSVSVSLGGRANSLQLKTNSTSEKRFDIRPHTLTSLPILNYLISSYVMSSYISVLKHMAVTKMLTLRTISTRVVWNDGMRLREWSTLLFMSYQKGNGTPNTYHSTVGGCYLWVRTIWNLDLNLFYLILHSAWFEIKGTSGLGGGKLCALLCAILI